MAASGPTSPTDEAWSFSQPGHRVQWPYNQWFGAHIRKRTKIAFVREHWDRDIGAVRARQKDERQRDTLERVEKAGAATLMTFLDEVSSLERARAFCERADIAPADLLAVLRRVYKTLPFGAQMWMLVSDDDPASEHVGKLSKHKLAYSLAFLEAARTNAGRQAIAAATGVPLPVVLDLAHRADFTRLTLMSGGMVRQLWALGYTSLHAVRSADPDEYYARCVEYYERTTKGMPFDLTRRNVVSLINGLSKVEPLVEE